MADGPVPARCGSKHSFDDQWTNVHIKVRSIHCCCPFIPLPYATLPTLQLKSQDFNATLHVEIPTSRSISIMDHDLSLVRTKMPVGADFSLDDSETIEVIERTSSHLSYLDTLVPNCPKKEKLEFQSLMHAAAKFLMEISLAAVSTGRG